MLVAALGPTNTGKTHRAIERMLSFPSGMIGLPLRLLAREVYDRVTARVGEEAVALVTGEEKRIPKRASFWVCTVEAMPMDRAVDFLAVDEIQLCGHRERGHVFTERLLHARGRRETWFLGSDTMRPMVHTLLPGASHQRFTRFSQLRYAGERSLRGLPPRSAVVAFSTDEVYEMAERLRRLRGGVAVVLGALSPRTRNAQVAMYQAGEVQYLVATDAIGMGLNLDVDHIAFASVRKFDGREHRALDVAELAQIAGRAGRHLNDGTFGTLRPNAQALPPNVALAIEEHRFSPVKKLVWRSTELDFASLDALIESLAVPPPHPTLRRVERADDFDALRTLAARDEVRALATTPPAIAQLWEVCQIPDFRKLLLHQHAALLLDIYRQLTRGDGTLDDTWLDAQVKRVDDVRGGIDQLTARLAAVRTWTYVAHRGAWLRDAAHWQERTRAIEDALGDALHQALVDRFVARATATPARRFARTASAAASTTPAASGPFAQLRDLSEAMRPPVAQPLTEDAFVEAVVDAEHDAFSVDRGARIWFEGERIARLVRGKDLRAPEIALEEPDAWTAGSRHRLERRLGAFVRDVVAEAMGGFRTETIVARANGATPEARGLAYKLDRGLGVVPRDDEVVAQLRALPTDLRTELAGEGLREGKRFVYVARALDPLALERRRVLASVFLGHPPPEGVPADPELPASAFATPDDAALFAYDLRGPIARRFDIAERAAKKRRRRRRKPKPR